MSLNFNNHVFNTLAESLGEAFPEILSVFFTETEFSLDALETKLNDKNMDDVQAIAHKIKSSTKTFGADGLVETLEKIESLTTLEHSEMVELQLSLKHEYKSVKEHIQNKMQ